MKIKNPLLLLTVALPLSLSALHAADNPAGHDPKAAGPKGGKIIETESGHAEFLVQPDRKVAVTFLDEKLKAAAPGEQQVSLTAQAPSGKAVLEFEKTAEGFVSKTTLPEGNGYMLVLQIRAKAGAKPNNLRIQLDLGTCGGCKLAEYACICEGHNH